MALVTATEYKTSRGISGTAYDTRIGEAINAASAKARMYCGRDLSNGFESAERTEVYDADGTGQIRLNEWPVSSIAAVKLRTAAASGAAVYGDTVDATGYYADNRGILHRVGGVTYAWEHNGSSRVTWGDAPSFVQVQYTAGYATIPDAIQEAVFALMDQWFDEAGRNVLSAQNEAKGVVNVANRSPMEITAAIADMLSPWRRVYA